jgi:FixJ family two-component response regulator
MNSELQSPNNLNRGAHTRIAQKSADNGGDTGSFLKPEARILIVAQDHAASRRLAQMVQSAGYHTSVFENASELLNSQHLHPPCCVLLESDLTQDNRLDLQQELARRFEFIPVIVLSDHSSVEVGIAAMKAGAVDYFVKPFEAAAIGDAIHVALVKQAKRYGLNQCSLRFHQGYQKLTIREREVLSFVINGFLNKQIAAELGISEKTIKVHRARVMKKMQVASFAELVRLAERAFIAENLSDERFSSNGSHAEPVPNCLL